MMRCSVRNLIAKGACTDQDKKIPAFTVHNGKRYVTVSRLTHPIRNQSIMLVPVPNIAVNTFYQEWCYQPYLMKHKHTLVICNDISTPAHIFGYFWFVGTNSGIKVFQPGKMPGPIELNVSRRDFTKRLIFLSCSILRLTFLTAKYRDRTCELSVIRHLRTLFGSRYIHHSVSLETHSKEDDAPQKDSFVLLFNASWVPHAIRHLKKEYGFEINEQVDVPIGQEEELARIERICHRVNTILLAWLAVQFVAFVIVGCNYFIEIGREEWVKENEQRMAD